MNRGGEEVSPARKKMLLQGRFLVSCVKTERHGEQAPFRLTDLKQVRCSLCPLAHPRIALESSLVLLRQLPAAVGFHTPIGHSRINLLLNEAMGFPSTHPSLGD
jgi:hypothetical protein